MNQQLLVILLFGFCLASCSRFPPRKYFYVDKFLSWFKAQKHCREHYSDLATFESMEDIKALKAPFSYSWAWIGLWDDPNSWKFNFSDESNSWRWSSTGETSKTAYQKWGSGPDFYMAKETCGTMYIDGEWDNLPCWSKSTFFCYNVTEQNVKQFAYISTLETWSSAQTYCREHYVDLAMIENESENNEARELKPNAVFSWIGLYRVPWAWSDKSPSVFRNWVSSNPENQNGNRHCVLENTLHKWGDEHCDITQVFICHQVVKMNTVVKVVIVTDADLTDPAINAKLLQQLGASLTRQGWTDFKMQWQNAPKD